MAALSNGLSKPDFLRLLYLLPRFELGGADKFNLDLLAVLRPRGYCFHLCATLPSANRWQALFEPLAEEIIILPEQYPLEQQPQALLELLQTRTIDLVLLVDSYLGYLLLPLLRAHWPRLPVVAYLHLAEPRWQQGGYPRLALEYQSLLNLTITSSQQLKDWLVERGGDPSRIEVCYTNIDPQLWNPARFDRAALRRALNLAPDTPLLLYAGRLVGQKRPRLMAQVVRRLAYQEKLNFVCLVAGDGPELPWLQTYLQENRLQPYLRLLGAVSLERMQELQAAADIFFLPSENEGVSLALYEALAMQTVPVAARVGGQAELVTPECGFLIAPAEDEIEAYTVALKQLIQSAGLRQRLAAAGRQRIETHFRLDQMAERMAGLLSQAGQLAQTGPALPVSPALGQICTARAVDYLRLLADYEQAGDYIARTGMATPRQVAEHMPLERLLKGLGLKFARKFRP